MTTVRFISGRAALGNFIHGIQSDASDRLEASGYNASGRLSKSLRSEVNDLAGAMSAELFGAGHWKFTGNGRGPGKRPPVDPLIQWAKDKGLASTEKQAAAIGWAIAQGIAKEGTLDHQLGGKNVFTEVVREAQPRIPEVIRAFLGDLRDPIIQQFTKAFAA